MSRRTQLPPFVLVCIIASVPCLGARADAQPSSGGKGQTDGGPPSAPALVASATITAGTVLKVDLANTTFSREITWRPAAIPNMNFRICSLFRAPGNAVASAVDWPLVPPISMNPPPTAEFLEKNCGKAVQVDGNLGRVRIFFAPAATVPGVYEMHVTNAPGGIEYFRGPRIVVVASGAPTPAALVTAPAADVVVGSNKQGTSPVDMELGPESNARPVETTTIVQTSGANVAYFVAGGVVGGAAIAAAALLLYWFWWRRRGRKGITVMVTTDEQGREVITIRRPDGNTLRGALPPAGSGEPLPSGPPEGKLPPSRTNSSGGEHVSSPSLSSAPSATASASDAAASRSGVPRDPASSRAAASLPREPGDPALRIAANLVASQQQPAGELFARAVCTKCLRVNPGCKSEDEAAEAACRFCRLPLVVNRRFFPVARVGGGEFGTTFAAVDLHFLSRRRCIVKKFTFLEHSSNEAHIEKAAQLFLDEGRTLENLDHACVPKLLGSFIWLQDMYHAMAEVRGQDLQRAMRARVHPYAPPDALAMMSDLLAALAYVHGRGVIHRDVKPSNVIAGENGRYYLVDFGLATAARPDLDQATEIGTYAYADPEQRAGRPTASSDLYSLAATCVEMLTKRRPAMEFFCDWTPARSPDTDVGPALGPVLARMLSRDPAARFPSAADVQEALFGPARKLQRGEGEAPSPGGSSASRASPRLPGPTASAFSDASSLACAYQLGREAASGVSASAYQLPALELDEVALEERPARRRAAPAALPPTAEADEAEPAAGPSPPPAPLPAVQWPPPHSARTPRAPAGEGEGGPPGAGHAAAAAGAAGGPRGEAKSTAPPGDEAGPGVRHPRS